MLKVLVLGCGGFIGNHLLKSLRERKNVSITAFGRKCPLQTKGITFIQGDFEDKNKLEKALENQDIVYHLISQTVPITSWQNPLIEIEKNLVPTINLIELAVKAKVKKICFASSGGTVYGYKDTLLNEESPTNPTSPYGIIKRTIESFLQYAKLKDNLNYDIYRISNVYGEGQDIDKGVGFINTSIEKIINNDSVTIFGDGENIRDYIYIQDVVELILLSLEKDLNDSDIYNICSGHQVSLNYLVGLMKELFKTDFEVEYVNQRQSDNKAVLLDGSKIMASSSKKELKSLEKGILKTFDLMKKIKGKYE